MAGECKICPMRDCCDKRDTKAHDDYPVTGSLLEIDETIGRAIQARQSPAKPCQGNCPGDSCPDNPWDCPGSRQSTTTARRQITTKPVDEELGPVLGPIGPFQFITHHQKRGK